MAFASSRPEASSFRKCLRSVLLSTFKWLAINSCLVPQALRLVTARRASSDCSKGGRPPLTGATLFYKWEKLGGVRCPSASCAALVAESQRMHGGVVQRKKRHQVLRPKALLVELQNLHLHFAQLLLGSADGAVRMRGRGDYERKLAIQNRSTEGPSKNMLGGARFIYTRQLAHLYKGWDENGHSSHEGRRRRSTALSIRYLR
jgi:hypothetical protein